MNLNKVRYESIRIFTTCISLSAVSCSGDDRILYYETAKSCCISSRIRITAFSEVAKINSYCKLKIENSPLLNFSSELRYDIVYFDAFAVARQPEMWDDNAIGHTLQFLKPGGIFVTYAITGNLKRLLKTLGCKVEKLPGAPGKREMLRAVKMH